MVGLGEARDEILQVMDDLKKIKVGSKNIWKVIPPGIRSFEIMSQGDARRESNETVNSLIFKTEEEHETRLA